MESDDAGEKSFYPSDIYRSDHLLRLLVTFANSEAGPLVTISVNGGFITGKLIGSQRYFEQLGAMFQSAAESAADPGYAALMADTLRLYARGASDFWSGDETTENKSDGIIHIHLENARFFSPGHAPEPADGFLWRGRVSEVSGFAIGSATSD